MKVTTEALATEWGVPVYDLRVGDDVEIVGTARVVGIAKKLVVSVFPGAQEPSPEWLVTLELDVRPA